MMSYLDKIVRGRVPHRRRDLCIFSPPQYFVDLSSYFQTQESKNYVPLGVSFATCQDALRTRAEYNLRVLAEIRRLRSNVSLHHEQTPPFSCLALAYCRIRALCWLKAYNCDSDTSAIFYLANDETV